MAIPDSQRYPWNHCLINNAENIVVFLAWTVVNSDNSNMFPCCSRNAQVHGFRETTINWKLNVSQRFLTVESGIDIFTWSVTWNYAYRPFKQECQLKLVWLFL